MLKKIKFILIVCLMTKLVYSSNSDSVVFRDDEEEVTIRQFPNRGSTKPAIKVENTKPEVTIIEDVYPQNTEAEIEQTTNIIENEVDEKVDEKVEKEEIEENEENSEEGLGNRILISAPKICPDGKRLDKRQNCRFVVE
jgi:hypothetical protein